MSGSRIADLRKKFAGKGDAFVPTPENQFTRMKKTKQQSANAVKIAKARAARYNMTLRALAIKTHHDKTKVSKADLAAKRKVKKDNAGYKATSRGLHVATAVTAKDKTNIAKALNSDVSPTVARDVIKHVAKKTHRHSKKRVQPKPIEDEEDVKTDDGIEEAPKKKSVKKSVNKVEMAGVSDALKTGNEKDLNKAILSNFLSTHAPHLENKTDELVEQFSESLGLLFQTLLKKYPNEVETEKSGEQKADKEIADAVASGDKKISEKVVAEDEDEDEDSSLVFDETALDEEEEDKPAPKPTITEIEIDSVEDDSSLVEVQDENFNRGYNKTLKKAEKSDAGVLKSLARRRTTMKLTQELAKEVDQYKKELEEEEGEDDSLIETPLVDAGAEDADEDESLIETPYIVNLEETKEEEDAPVKWAVQFQNNTKKLKAKLLKQGLTEEQVELLVDNLDQNTSEML